MIKKILAVTALLSGAVMADTMTIPVNLVSSEGVGKNIGEITISETSYGLLFTPHLKELPPGLHGFHIHENASCDPGLINGKKVPALAAGGHYDPEQTNKHLGPYNPEGHLGDLPALYVNSEGNAENPVLSPKIKKISQIKERAIMIHAGGDNHSDSPAPLGGGGAQDWHAE
ncbi:superoxide dismutase [Cu-Zn] 1 [Escherichia coli RN587/1]|nr:superoxide dismutase [Cu-Zn] 1 [Escherichia coli RN587/1]